MADNAQSPKLLHQFFADLERLAAILMVLRSGVNQRIERYGRLTTAIERREDLFKADSPLQLTALEKSRAKDALDGDVYTIDLLRNS